MELPVSWHSFYAFIPGYSVRTYTDEQLQKLNEKENEEKVYRGCKYNAYQAAQAQRQMETKMRSQRAYIKNLERGDGSNDDILAAKARYLNTLHQYQAFSRKMELPEQMERVYMDGLGRVITDNRIKGMFPQKMVNNMQKDLNQYKRYKEVLGDSIGSLAKFGQMKYNDTEKWKEISEAYTDVKWQKKALEKREVGEVHSVPFQGTPDSVFDNYIGETLQRRRYYGSDGRPRLDIDMTDHGNSKEHPVVPHYHNWYRDQNGTVKREAKHDNELKLGHKIANKDILEKR